MADLKLDSTGDLAIENDSFIIVDGDDAIVQHLTIRFRFFLGEWFLDTRIGVPYFDSILVKNPNLVIVRGIMRQIILTTPGISFIESFEFTYNAPTRAMQVDFKARKVDNGLLDYSKEFILT